jgi:acyl-CoA synthetase (AMP-forming)/AMP-acid ligase II
MRLARQLFVLTRQGVLLPGRPDRLVRQVASILTWGAGIAGEIRQAAARSPDAVAVVDVLRGEITYAGLLASSERAAGVLLHQGLSAGDRVGVLCRNHLALVELLGGASTAGIDVVLLNTGLVARQISEVVERESISFVVHDDEFTALVADLSVPSLTESRFTALLDEMAPRRPVPPRRAGRVVVLTSGTTGPPKGARRPHPRSLSGLASVLDRLPLRPRQTVLLSAPIFHTWGFGSLQLALAMRDTIVLQRRFDPVAARDALVEHRCQVMFAVPVMLQRMLALDTPGHDRGAPPPEPAQRHTGPSSRRQGGTTVARGRQFLGTRRERRVESPEGVLRIVAVSGSSLPGGLATRFMNAYGPVLYNVYGSTEVSWAAIADPRDLMAAPACSGRPPHGTRVLIVAKDGRQAPSGQVGRVFVGNEMLFSGYTDGDTPERWHGLVDTGDLGHIEGGRLYLDGREDDLVVSGGENVRAGEVEDVISGMDQVHEAAVFGVEDEEFGQRLVAYVVPEPGVKLQAADVARYVSTRVARHARPREVVVVDRLPRNETGKVLLRELREGHGPDVPRAPE